LLLLEHLNLAAQGGSLACLIDSRADGSGNRDSDYCLLQSGHGDSFDGGEGCAGCSCGESGSDESGGGGNRDRQAGGRGLDGVRSEDKHQPAGSHGDTSFGKAFAQAVHRAVDALLRGLVTNAEALRHLVGGLAFKVAQHQRVAVALAQFAQGGIELGRELVPRGVGFGGKQFIHGGGILFAGATPHIGADGLRGNVLRGAMQPAG
jgi:hypothetical protein